MTTIPKPDKSRVGRMRDIVAHSIANFSLKHIATPWYRGMIEGAIRLGLETAAKEGNK